MVEAGSLKKGDHIIKDGDLFVITKAKPVIVSRHSHAKTKLEMSNVFTGEKRSFTLPSGEEMEKVKILKKHGQLIAKIKEDLGQIMDMRDYSIREATIPSDLKVKEGDDVVYIEFGKKARLIGLWEK
jgi:translation elongation factor P/translation initiation factor 5A